MKKESPSERNRREIKVLAEMLVDAKFKLLMVDDEKTPTIESVVDAVCAVDDSRLYVESPEGKTLGLYIVLGNDLGEAVCDYHVDKHLEKVVNAYYDRFEKELEKMEEALDR